MPGIWSGSAARTYKQFVSCPTAESAQVTPKDGSPFEVSNAIGVAFNGFLYGYDANGDALKPWGLNSQVYVPIAPGVLTVFRTGVLLTYAVVEVGHQRGGGAALMQI